LTKQPREERYTPKFNYCVEYFQFAASAKEYATGMTAGNLWRNIFPNALRLSSAMDFVRIVPRSTMVNGTQIVQNECETLETGGVFSISRELPALFAHTTTVGFHARTAIPGNPRFIHHGT
jgi:hypothetical protein